MGVGGGGGGGGGYRTSIAEEMRLRRSEHNHALFLEDVPAAPTLNGF